MTPSKDCIELIKSSEKFIAKPYLCPAGIPTIGYGSTRYENGVSIKLTDPAITEPRAAEIMMFVLQNEYAPAVSRYAQIQLTQGQFDALVDFAYNAGVQNLRTSTLLKLVNLGKFDLAAKEFAKWVNAKDKSGTRVKLKGLVIRREAERQLFLKV